MPSVPGSSEIFPEAPVVEPAAMCRLRLHAARDVARRGEPVEVGVPFPPGALYDISALSIAPPTRSEPVPFDARVLERWPDQSVRWALCSFQVTWTPGEEHILAIRQDDSATPDRQPLIETISSDAVRVATGAATFEIRSHPDFHVTVRDDDPAPWAVMRIRIVDAHGAVLSTAVSRLEVEHNGTLQATVSVTGRVTGVDGLTFAARIQCFRGLTALGVELTVRNSKAAAHPGGFWDLGDSASVFLREIALVTTFEDVVYHVRCSVTRDEPLRSWEKPFEIYQESSGGRNWKSSTHRNRDNVIPLERPGYEARDASHVEDGTRATPIVQGMAGAREFSVAMPYFWQAFPKSIEVADDRLTIGILPGRFPDAHELQGGEQTSHTAWLAFGRDSVTEMPLDWCRDRTLAIVSPGQFAAAEALPYLAPADADPDRRYQQLVSAAVEGADAFVRRREMVDEYGWRNFGDFYADHEAVGQLGDQPVISHYNNQYDGAAGCICQFMRTGDPRWWTLADELVRHVVDVDVYHTSNDKAAYSGGLFWHTNHYTDAATSTHRCYSRRASSASGGPSAEHNYTTGLMLHYLMTGRIASRDTVLELAEWVVRMDDGRMTPFRWLSRGATGVASSTADPEYQGPGRGAGNSINALLDAHRLTHDDRWLTNAEALIRRCIHPEDDIDALDLRDAERRWSYTVFLQVLGKYLDYKALLLAFDDSYWYGRASLLRYAAWMVEHEEPYLNHPERLEFPNETWAAQDMRKADVFRLAARHGTGVEQARFLERSQFFFEYVLSALSVSPTARLTRPVVILLSNGYAQGRIRSVSAVGEGSQATADFGAPAHFVPQKRLARTRAVIAAVVGSVMLAIAIFAFR